MNEARIFDDYDEFQKVTGLIDDDETLLKIGTTASVGESDDGKFDTALLDKLKEFCAQNPQFHIATMTSDSDDSETTECERRAAAKGLVWDELGDDAQDEFREKEEIWATTIDNSIRFVNRYIYCSAPLYDYKPRVDGDCLLEFLKPASI